MKAFVHFLFSLSQVVAPILIVSWEVPAVLGEGRMQGAGDCGGHGRVHDGSRLQPREIPWVQHIVSPLITKNMDAPHWALALLIRCLAAQGAIWEDLHAVMHGQSKTSLNKTLALRAPS